ncbi:MAG: ATP-binding protein [Coriobacteriales bacterium]|nr:ATP-binding protein [Coriobacteriales bacterium]
MNSEYVRLSVPAEASYARVVRMTASSLAVLADMGVDDVEDVRMAAEEGFVYACATAPEVCDVTFTISDNEVCIDYLLGDVDAEDDDETDLDLIEALLFAVCDDFGFSNDGSTLRLVKKAGTHAR